MIFLKMATNNLQQLINITGSDEGTAENLLSACDGNLQLAIEMYLESSGNSLPDRGAQTEGETSAASTSTSSVLNREESQIINDDDNIRAPIPQQRGVLVTDPYHAVPLPRTKRKNPTSVFDSFRDFQAEAKKQEELLKRGSSLEACKARTLQDLFRPPVDITFKGTFEMAKSAGAEQHKWLLVNIQNVTEFPCQTLNRDVWSNDVVRAILNEHFLLWQVYCDSDEGQRYMLYYTVKRYPYIAVIDPRTGECMTTWESSEGLDAQKFCDVATQFVSSNADLNQQQCEEEEQNVSVEPCKKKSRQNSIVDASEDSQLAAAIAASLTDGSNKPKALVVKDDSSNDDSDGSLQEFSADESEKEAGNSLAKKNKVVTQSVDIDVMNDIDNTDVNGKVDETKESEILKETEFMVSIMIRFPDGTRSQEKLNKLATIKELSTYISSKGYTMDRHEIMMTFPRRNLSVLDRSLTLKEADFGNQETIFLQEK